MKKIICLLLCLILAAGPAVLPAACGDAADPCAPSEKTYSTTYAALLKMWIRVINGEGRSRHDLFNDNLYDRFSDYGDPAGQIEDIKDSIGYSILDINQDGCSELVMTFIDSLDGSAGRSVLSLFTAAKDGRVRELVRGGAPSAYLISKSGEVCRSRPVNSRESVYEIYRFNGTKALKFHEGFLCSGEDYRLPPSERESAAQSDVRYYYSVRENQSPVPEGQAPLETETVEQRLAEFETDATTFRITSLADFERREYGSEVYKLAVNGKTAGSNTVNIRQKPDSKSRLVVKKRVGTAITVLQEEGDYYLVSVGDKEGYVQKQYVTTVIDPSRPQRPAGTPKPAASVSPAPGPTETSGSTSTPKPGPTETSGSSSTPGPGPTGSVLPAPSKPTPEPTPATTSEEKPSGPVIDHYEEQTVVDGYQYILDHYEEQTVQRSRQVIDHYETDYTTDENGEKVPYERPVYKTEYYDDINLVPIYRTETVYKTILVPVYK